MSTQEKAPKAEPQVIKLTLSGILADLNEGLGRKEIARKYGLSNSAVKALFERPELKGKKAKKPTPFELEIDVEVPKKKEKKVKPTAETTPETATATVTETAPAGNIASALAASEVGGEDEETTTPPAGEAAKPKVEEGSGSW